MRNTGLQDWPLVLILISTVLACWGVSLLLRLVSEYIARKRKRLHAEHHRKGVVLALVSMGLSWAASGASAWFAYDIIARTGGVGQGVSGIVAVVCLGLVLFGLILLVWAGVGDRARGRLRCPRCWYDMQGMSDAPRCPECGREIRSPRQLRRARRARWPVALAGVLIGTAAYGFSRLNKIDDSDMLALVPTWAMMTGWEHLPETWVLMENSPYEATLEYRLYNGWEEDEPWISRGKAGRFGRRLCEGLLRDAETRWDHRRLQLISAVSLELTHAWPPDAPEGTEQAVWTGAPIEADALLIASARDLVGAMRAKETSELQIRMLELGLAQNDWENTVSPYGLAREWIDGELTDANPYEDPPGGDPEWTHYTAYRNRIEALIRRRCAAALAPMRELFAEETYRALLLSSDELVVSISADLLMDAGLCDLHYAAYLAHEPDPALLDPGDRAIRLALMASSLSENAQSELWSSLTRMLGDDDRARADHALRSVMLTQGLLGLDGASDNDAYLACVAQAIALGTDDPGAVFPESHLITLSRHQLALRVLDQQDTTGERAYPLFAAQLRADPGATPYLRGVGYDVQNADRIPAWLEHFEAFVSSEDPAQRVWVMENFPMFRGGEHDQRLNALAASRLDDENEEVAGLARDALRYRDAEDMIPPDDED